ncbi:alpha/beta fold hydrolase [Streptomyces sp. NPDC056480]|uniref:alpha/beta hydrolase family protein n=1 Tax=Streptomyces sp. NPDC056480 TaxID=3345833 RepID=UPI003691C4EF
MLLSPALGVSADYYAPFCSELAESGVAVLVADLRGQGNSVPLAGRATRHGYHQLASEDWPSLIAWARRRFGSDIPLYILGHSIGGQISLHYAALAPGTVEGLVLVASGSVHYRSFQGAARFRVLVGTQLVAAISTVLGYWPGRAMKFGGRQPARLMRDWARIARTGRFRPEGADIDYEARMANVRLPVLSISLEGDSLAPPSAVDHLCSKLPSSRVERWHYQPAHGKRADHVRWVRSGVEIAAYIRSWLDDNAVRSQGGNSR